MQGRRFVLGWLGAAWLLAGPLLAFFTMVLFFSDEHGLPTSYAGLLVIYLVLLTTGFGKAVRVILSWREDF